MTGATILIPTFDHGPTLLHSVPTALAQTQEDVEVFVVGDGAPDVTRDIMADFCRADRRVRFFNNPKGARHGELLRHAALAVASGRIVCYLSDDDLLFPDHVEVMSRLLERADFGHTLVTGLDADGRLYGAGVDLGNVSVRRKILEGWSLLHLSCVGHTLAGYRRLPHGWRTTPAGAYTDLHMWQQWLDQTWLRAASDWHLTVVHFPSTNRRGWSPDRRCAELASIRQRMGTGLQIALVEEAAAFFAAQALDFRLGIFDRDHRIAELERQLAAADLARGE